MKNFLDETIPNQKIDKVIFSSKIKSPIVSVIIVAYNPNIELFERIIISLKTNNCNSYEILVTENSDKPYLQNLIVPYELNYIKLKHNYGLNVGRNVGINHAKGQILIFLDDDAIPGENFIYEHIKAHEESNVVALRGKCLPRTKSVFNSFAYHYDLGNEVIPYYVNLECNMSFSKKILVDVGGFNTMIEGAAGHEGLEISKRIINSTRNKNSIIYYPRAIVFHNYSKSLIHYLRKQIRHEYYFKHMIRNHPDFLDFLQSYKKLSINSNYNNLDYITKSKVFFIRKLRRAALKLTSNSTIYRFATRV